ncbi:hypothetical protein [Aminicella lysinilytica]|jgi:hypothetical protein|uniref:Uncharacterized protein n=1 Tax=Aminicella lysinilytica TaxID=433323 RepID=A0A4R6QCB3_9FIRM|nr:hypothetical protein [Aminicella lysinilytica]NLD10833.1 hypothetical protein [Clostridiales bacterium]TDP59777.1 hypothetical protein EV211_10216 [Aminicella lysinilytica]
MLQDTVTDYMVNTVLKQMGAVSIKVKPCYINIAKFELDTPNDSKKVEVFYLYEMKENDDIYLQRLEPYPMLMGKPSNENELIKVIRADIDKFKSALTSTNFCKFLDLQGLYANVNKSMEELLLSPKTVRTEDLLKIESDLKAIGEDMAKMSENAKLPE